jgi:hypothetical protein
LTFNARKRLVAHQKYHLFDGLCGQAHRDRCRLARGSPLFSAEPQEVVHHPLVSGSAIRRMISAIQTGA